MNIQDYQNELNRGFIGQIEYKLHKNKTWIAQLFTNIADKENHLNTLKEGKYNVDKIVYFEFEIIKLNNPNWTATERLQGLINFVETITKTI